MTPPSIDEQLTAAASRILTDERRHEPQATMWARRYLEAQAAARRLTRIYLERTRHGFSARELSLGAQAWE
jgi:hypothetical protein